MLGDVVDAIVVVLVGLAVGIHHGGLVPLTGKAVFLKVTFLLAIPAGGGRVSNGSGGGRLVAVVTSVVDLGSGIMNGRKLVKLLVRQVFPDDLLGSLLLQLLFDRVDAVEPLMVVLDGLQVAGDLDALGECVLGSLKHLVADAILQTGQKKMVLYKFEGVVDTFSFDVSCSSSYSGPDGSHGGGLFVCETLVGHWT